MPFNPRSLGTDLQLDNLGLLLVEQMATWSVMVCLPETVGRRTYWVFLWFVQWPCFCPLLRQNHEVVFVFCIIYSQPELSCLLLFCSTRDYWSLCDSLASPSGNTETQLEKLVQFPCQRLIFSFFETIPSIEKKKKDTNEIIYYAVLGIEGL